MIDSQVSLESMNNLVLKLHLLQIQIFLFEEREKEDYEDKD